MAKKSKRELERKKRIEAQRRRINLKKELNPKPVEPAVKAKAAKIIQYNYNELLKYTEKYYKGLVKSYKKYGATLEDIDVPRLLAQKKVTIEATIFKHKDPYDVAKSKVRELIKRESGVLTSKQLAAMTAFTDTTEMEFKNALYMMQLEPVVIDELWNRFNTAKAQGKNIMKAALLQEIYKQLKAMGVDPTTAGQGFIGRYVFGSD